jgi:hypothetical protein
MLVAKVDPPPPSSCYRGCFIVVDGTAESMLAVRSMAREVRAKLGLLVGEIRTEPRVTVDW